MDKKYTSLEHSIRNIVSESIGVTGKSKPEGTPRSFLKPVGTIAPPKGEEHPGTKKTATVLAQRGEDKVKHALESVEEEQLDELLQYAPVVAGKLATKYGDDALKALDDLFKKGKNTPSKKIPEKGLEAPVEAPTKPSTVPAPKTEPIKTPEKTPETPVAPKVPEPDKPKPVLPTKPAPETVPETPSVPKPTKAPVPEKTPGTEKSSGPSKEPTPAKEPSTSPSPSPTPVPGPAPGFGRQPGRQGGKSRTKSGDNKKRLPFGIPVPGINPEIISGLRGYVPTTPYLHYAQDYVREENEADNARKAIENVARPGGKNRVTKQAEIKNKIIDENKKLSAVVKKTISDKKNSTVKLNPKLKHPEVDEN